MTTTETTVLSRQVLDLDCAAETTRIVEFLRRTAQQQLRRRGIVLGLSGGIDSSVCAALAVRAFGPEKVLGIFMPEQDSASESLDLGHLLAEHLGIPSIEENISAALEGAGCYRRRDEAIQSVIPEYRPDWKSKIVLPNILNGSPYRLFQVVVQSPSGEQHKARLPLEAYQTIVAATNFKQRVRKMIEYYHADRLRYAVLGTPNRLEYDQGFFVKNGDGASDVKPIAHLYKSQVYQLAAYLEVPEVIQMRPPTTDTYSLEQSQEEFFFSLSYADLDLCLWAHNHQVPASVVAEQMGWSVNQAELVYRDIESKRSTTRYLHEPPLTVENIFSNGASS